MAFTLVSSHRIKQLYVIRNEQFSNNILHKNTHKSMQKLINKYNLIKVNSF